MNRALKTFLIWLLMAVLPLHAAAAGIGMSCSPVHQQAQVQTAHAGQRQAVSGGDEHAHHGGAHAAHLADAASEAHAHAGLLDSPDSLDKPAKTEQQTHSSCSACSAFCVGAVAPPSAFLPFPSFDGAEALIASPVDFLAGFIPDGLQRPPRHPSA